MSSKCKKAKKKAKQPSDVVKAKDTLTSKKIHAYFTNEEITQVKTLLKIKDVTNIPLAVAATVLYKFDLLNTLLKDGYDINQTGQNNMTALMWAVKLKFMDIIDFLIANGADATIKTDSGDNIPVAALENKIWDEESFIKLWKTIKTINLVDVNFTNKSGHSMLHMCVRRDWEAVLKILLAEKANVDSANANGVTPLMLACFRSNLNMIDALLRAGSDILKEDHHGRMPLCYAISMYMKSGNSTAADRIVSELKQKHSFGLYIKRRLELISVAATKREISPATSEILTKTIRFAVHNTKDGLKILLDQKISDQLFKSLTTNNYSSDVVKFLLEIGNEVLFYSEDTCGFDANLKLQMVQDFQKSGYIDFCSNTMNSKFGLEVTCVAFKSLLLSNITNDESWIKLLQKNYAALSGFLNHFEDHLVQIEDDNRAKAVTRSIQLKDQVEVIRKSLENHEEFCTTCNTGAAQTSCFDERKKMEHLSSNSKKSRRRAKALKAKLTKIKSAELSKRLSFTSKKAAQQQKSPKSPAVKAVAPVTTKEPSLSADDFEINNPLVCSFRHLFDLAVEDIANDQSDVDANDFDDDPEWKKRILNTSFSGFPRYNCGSLEIDEVGLFRANSCIKNAVNGYQIDANDVNTALDIIFNYLRCLMKFIIQKYKELWERDKSLGVCTCNEFSEHVPWLFGRHLKIMETRERLLITDLQTNFDNLLVTLQDLSSKNLGECYKSINKLESSLLNYKIREAKLMSYITNMGTFRAKYSIQIQSPNMTDEEAKGIVAKYMEDVLNGDNSKTHVQINIQDDVPDIINFENKPESDEPYETVTLTKRDGISSKTLKKQMEARTNTMQHSFHLVDSIMAICDDDCDTTSLKQSYANQNLKFTMDPKVAEHLSSFPRRIQSQIGSLQNAKSYQKFLQGRIRLCDKAYRINYVISAGINFTAVELGLDLNDQPLAVKRISKESWVGKVLKDLVKPLMGLSNDHVLHYFACEYEENELILATPLCQCNLSQYIQVLKKNENSVVPGPNAMDIVKQFLSGLMALHKRETAPIVHGNLKPSNIFIDFGGLVKIAEFGIHSALYKIIEAPKTSLIWFATETLDLYMNSNVMECTTMSDIYVAGMLMYFVLSHGNHPFGDSPDEIIRNIQNGAVKLDLRNEDLKDLLYWMTTRDSKGRPDIEQVLMHTFFWSSTKKWQLILTCAGVNIDERNHKFLNLEQLHKNIDFFCIKCTWHETIRSNLPKIPIAECFSNTLGGLLKFIKHCYEEQQPEEFFNLTELSCIILTTFPDLCVSLHRMITSTKWMKHEVFLPFTHVVGAGSML